MSPIAAMLVADARLAVLHGGLDRLRRVADQLDHFHLDADDEDAVIAAVRASAAALRDPLSP